MFLSPFDTTANDAVDMLMTTKNFVEIGFVSNNSTCQLAIAGHALQWSGHVDDRDLY